MYGGHISCVVTTKMYLADGTRSLPAVITTTRNYRRKAELSETEMPEMGVICWQDLTVQNADEVRDFYQAVAGWQPEAVDMGGYSDYTMFVPETGKIAGGICHARGVNADMPAQWLIYIPVPDIQASVTACIERGGEVVVPIRDMDDNKFCVIRDPAGAVCALIQ